MAKVNYAASSPYFITPQTSWYLGPLQARDIPAHSSDAFIPIKAKYNNRPDLLSFDIYGTPAYWWVFMQRNLDLIRDPIWDFQEGMFIYVPSIDRLTTLLG